MTYQATGPAVGTPPFLSVEKYLELAGYVALPDAGTCDAFCDEEEPSVRLFSYGRPSTWVGPRLCAGCACAIASRRAIQG